MSFQICCQLLMCNGFILQRSAERQEAQLLLTARVTIRSVIAVDQLILKPATHGPALSAVNVDCRFGGQQCQSTLRPDNRQQRTLKRKRILIITSYFVEYEHGEKTENFIKETTLAAVIDMLTSREQVALHAVAKRPRDASCLSVVSFVASIVQYLERSFFYY